MNGRNYRRGVTVMLAVILLVVLIVMVAFAVDVGIMMLDRTNAQVATDAGSLAAASVLGDNGTEADMRDAATSYLVLNGMPVDVAAAATIQSGNWDAGTRIFSSVPYADAAAIQVQVRDSNRPLFFGRIFQSTDFTAAANAIAIAHGSDPQDIMLVIDCSTSMASNSRMTYTRGAAMARGSSTSSPS